MNRKIFINSIIVGVLTGACFTALCIYLVFNLAGSFSSTMSNETKSLVSSIQDQFASHQNYSFNQIKTEFLHKSKEKIKKDAETVLQMIKEFSIISAREHLQNVFQNDPDIISVSLVVYDESEFKLWSHVSSNLPLGVGFNNEYDEKYKLWSSEYQGVKTQVKINFLEQEKKIKSLKLIEDSTNKASIGEITILMPIVDDKDQLGVLVYKFTLKSVRERIAKDSILFKGIEEKIEFSSLSMIKKFSSLRGKSFEFAIMAIGLIIFLTVIFIIYYSRYVGNKITHPIQSLLGELEKVKKGIYETHEVISSKDEIQVLSENFNKMVVGIKERDEQLLNYQNNLESLVDERTKELEIEKQKNIQESKLRSLGEMAAGIAHEINNPLGVIAANIRISDKLLEKEEIDIEAIKKRMNKVGEMIDRITRIIEGIRDFSRDQSSVEKINIDISEVINDSLSISQERIKNHMIELEVDLIQEDLIICTKKIEMSQVIVNLISNAFYVVQDLESANEKWIKVSTEKEGDYVLVKVQNGGPKIEEGIINKIMEPFFTTKPVGEGTGLGLSISRGIVISNDGEFYVDVNNPSTTFVVKLPLVKNP